MQHTTYKNIFEMDKKEKIKRIGSNLALSFTPFYPTFEHLSMFTQEVTDVKSLLNTIYKSKIELLKEINLEEKYKNAISKIRNFPFEAIEFNIEIDKKNLYDKDIDLNTHSIDEIFDNFEKFYNGVELLKIYIKFLSATSNKKQNYKSYNYQEKKLLELTYDTTKYINKDLQLKNDYQDGVENEESVKNLLLLGFTTVEMTAFYLQLKNSKQYGKIIHHIEIDINNSRTRGYVDLFKNLFQGKLG